MPPPRKRVISLTSSSDANLLRQIIMDHYQNPRNKGLVDDESYVTVHLKNPSCGDDLTIQVKAVGDTIEAIRQQGTGCSICCSSASMMSELLEAKTLTEAQEIIQNFRWMVSAEPFSEELLGDAVALQGVSHLPQRVKCATLGWKACEVALEKIQEDNHE